MIRLAIATILTGCFAIVVRFGQRRNGNLLAIGAANYVVASLSFLPVFYLVTTHVSRQTVLVGAGGGLIYATAYFLLLPVLRAKGVAISTAVMRLSVVLPMLLSLLLWQEVPTAVQAAGAGLAFAALPLLALGRARGTVPLTGKQPLAPLVALFLFNGACLCVQKVYQTTGAFAERPAFFMALFGTAALYAGTVWLIKSRQLSPVDLAIGALLGLVNAAANFANLAALDLYSGVVFFPVTAAGGLVFATLFAAVVWRETPSKWGALGIALAVVAVALVNVGSALEQPAYRQSSVLDASGESPFAQRSGRRPTTEGGSPAPDEEGTDEMAEPETLASLWDLEEIAAAPLRLQELRRRTTGWGRGRLRQRELLYYSHDWAGGEVVIHAHLALPSGRTPAPAVVMGTGDADSGAEFSRKHGVATLAVERPGTGESSGPEDDYANWVQFDDPRESWMWHYVNAALRAVTLLSTLPEVDADRIGITGASRGGTMAWIANGVDPRLKLALPVATGGDIVRALDHGGWANYIHRDEAGQPCIPDEFHRFARFYDPMLYCGSQHGGVMLVVGAQDEFFPLYCTATTAQASAEDDFRMLIVANWDHGYFTGDNAHVDAFDNREEASRKTDRAVGAAIDHWLRGTARMPGLPELDVERQSDHLVFTVTPADPDAVGRVAVQVSTDGAYTFGSIDATREGPSFRGELVGPDTAVLAGVAAFAEVEYTEGPILTSIPWFGPAFRQIMRPFPEPDES
jgi:drug/metabolite transporter (DMT)-like permease/dienelactone hydrolase